MTIDVRFWGTRGSFPALGPQFARYGGDTSCVSAACAGATLVFDAGSGLARFGKALTGPVEIDLFVSHLHLDHIMGLPYFDPMWRRETAITIWMDKSAGGAIRKALQRQFAPPFHPVRLSQAPARVIWRTYRVGRAFAPRPGVTMIAAPLPHPGGATGFRVEHQGVSFVYGADCGALTGARRSALRAWAADADLLVLDATFTCAEAAARPDWGHMSWKEACEFGVEARAARVGLFHHGPDQDDAALDTIEREARAISNTAFLARDGMDLRLERHA